MKVPSEIQTAVARAIVFCINEANQGRGFNNALICLLDIPKAVAKHCDDVGPIWLSVRLLYVLNNLSAWRSDEALNAKASFRDFVATHIVSQAKRFAHEVTVPNHEMVCAWCKVVMFPGIQPVSHGICKGCCSSFKKTVLAPKTAIVERVAQELNIPVYPLK